MKELLNKMLIPQDKANHFVWTVLILTSVLASVIVIDYWLEMELSFFFIMGLSFMLSAVAGLLKEIRDYATGKGTPSFMDTLANLYGLLVAFVLVVLSILAYR